MMKTASSMKLTQPPRQPSIPETNILASVSLFQSIWFNPKANSSFQFNFVWGWT